MTPCTPKAGKTLKGRERLDKILTRWSDDNEYTFAEMRQDLQALVEDNEAASAESPLAELKELLEFARGREAFGIQTDIENRPDPETRTKGNKTGQAYGNGYSEASRNIMDEIQRRINAKEEHQN